MKRAIFLRIALLTAFVAVIMPILLGSAMYSTFVRSVFDGLRQSSEAYRPYAKDEAISLIKASSHIGQRYTVYSPNGQAVFDSNADISQMENGSSFQEILQAMQKGTGQASRASQERGKEDHFFAVRLSDGYILRAMQTASGISSMFATATPYIASVVIIALLAGYIAASRLAKQLLGPINEFGATEGPETPYEELVPFIRALERQRNQIDGQLEEIKSRNEAINAIIENMNEGAVLLDGNGAILSANKSALIVFDAGPNMSGKDIRELFRDSLLIEKTREALSGKRDEIQMSRGGRDYLAYFSPVPGNGAILFFIDTTERSRVEKLRREFSANVSHELKTPLTSILGYAEMLEYGMAREEDMPAFAHKIKFEAQRLIRLVEDIMLISRLDEQSQDEMFENVGLPPIVESAVEALSLKAQEKGVGLECAIAGSIEGLVYANASMLDELVYNLIDNAIKFNKPGGKVRAMVSESDGKVSLTVEDDGIGIPKSAQKRVFERFYRVEKSRSKTTGGSGLGLSIVKHIALIHAAEISLESEEGLGTTIKVEFPPLKEA